MLSAVKTDNVNSVVFACIVNSGSFLIKALNGCYTRITLTWIELCSCPWW